MNYFLIRAVKYYESHGLFQSISRLWILMKRRLFQNAFIIYYSNLINLNPLSQNYLDFEVESKKKQNDLTEENCRKLYKYQDERILKPKIRDRFDKGAVLWLAKLNDEIVGFIWSIRRHTVKPFFFPLLYNDVYLFDNEIFEDYRGKGINSVFVDKVLMELRSEGYIRAFIDTRIWNISEINSLSKTGFTKLTVVSQIQLFGKNVVIWHNPKN
ncbi:MAG: GNAT family N-acetyltransferase [Syntrophomonas sp.]